jgi:hypothetical protein
MESNMVYSKESFDRFGDDLCELLLSYLSISDKIHFECLSKQWQRLMFNKQQKLILSLWGESYDTIVIRDEIWQNHKFSIIKSLTKKIKFITNLEINIRINDQMLEIIAKSCQFLTKIKFDGKDIYRKYYKIFEENLGQKLEFIDINNIEIIEMVSLLRFN